MVFGLIAFSLPLFLLPKVSLEGLSELSLLPCPGQKQAAGQFPRLFSMLG